MRRGWTYAMKKLVGVTALFVVGAVLFGIAAFSGAKDAEALAPCVAHSNTIEEVQFLGLLQSWRDQNIPGSHTLFISAPLNAAAAGYAQFLADTPGASGHHADGSIGYAWAERAIQCGYPANLAGGGEGLAVQESTTGSAAISAQQALQTMSAHGGSGIWVPSNIGIDVRCVGVAKATSADGRKVAWVALVFAGGTPCPAQVNATPTSPPNTPTATPTRTPSPTPTRPPAQRHAVQLPLLACDACTGGETSGW